VAAKKKVKKPTKLSAAELAAKKLKDDHSNMVRAIFRRAGFMRIRSLCDREFTYKGQKTDFDEVFVFENVLVCIETTTTASANIGAHLKPKKIVYDKIQSSDEEFARFLCGLSNELELALFGRYQPSDVIVRIVYASRNSFDTTYKENVPNPIYLDYPILRYFKSTTESIHRTSRHELLEFLKVGESSLGHDGAVGVGWGAQTYVGSLLPESSSNFDDGYKVVSFYIDPLSLLERAYVLRRDGWRQSYNLYQRLLSKEKIDSIRKYLKREKRVFVNNVIATLPYDTKVLDGDGNTVDPKDIKKTRQVRIQIPHRHNSIGVVDGQHRTYAYYEGVEDDSDIAALRRRQNLLVTGVIYPEGVGDEDREKFEARLFLEINSNQTTAKSNLKQAIGLILDPFAPESVAARVLDVLDRGSGPLSGQVERYFFDKNKLKPTSIISYGLRPLVKLSGADSLFAKWAHVDKHTLAEGTDPALLEQYVAFCVAEINAILVGFRKNIPAVMWSTEKATEGRMLTTTFVNAVLIVLRLLIEQGKTGTQSWYGTRLSGIAAFDIKSYHSSQYRAMAEAIVGKFFS